MKKILIVTAFIIASNVCALRGADLDLSGLETPADRLPAVRRLFNWVQSMGYDVKLSTDGEEIFLKDYKLVVSPFASTSRPDTLLVFNTYVGYPENVGNAKLEAEIAAINQEQASVHVMMKSNGGIMFVSELPFDDSLSPKLFRMYMEFCNKQAQYILGSHPILAARVR